MKTKGHFKTKSFLFLSSFILLTGCSSSSVPNNIAIISNDYGVHTAEVKLAQAADSSSQALEQLAEIERSNHPQAKLPQPIAPESIGMAQPTTVEWNGPVGPLVAKIAQIAHYKVHVLGTVPAIPPLVSISAKDTPLADILRDVGFQCGSKVNIVVYPSSKIIELRYAKV